MAAGKHAEINPTGEVRREGAELRRVESPAEPN